MKLEGRVAIVTGAAQGIGRAIADKLREEGATVAVADLNADGDRCALLPQLVGDGAADALCGTGDDRHTSLELHAAPPALNGSGASA